MALKRKLKKISKIFLWIYILLSIAMLSSSVLLTINISYLVGIETFIRIIVLIVIYLLFGIYILYGFVWLFENKKIKLFLFSLLITIFTAVSFFASYYINKTYRIIDSINKDEITYTTSLITLKDYDFENTKETTVGMISDEEDITGSVLAKELIEKEKLNVTVKYYDDYYEMISLLFNKEIDGLFIPGNYESLFSEEDTSSDMSEETKVIYSHSKTMKKVSTSSTAKSINSPFTVLLLGVDSTSDGLNANAAFNGDAIMLITFNPKTLTATFLSIPRDTYVPIACRSNREAKINSAAVSGSSCMINTIKNFTGIEIDYYYKMNFTGIVDLVNALGGIEVNVPYKFCEQNSKRQWGKNTLYVNAGLQKLDGEKALALTRNRKASIHCSSEWNTGNRNDFVRGQNQQLVLSSILNKIKTMRSIDDLYKVLNVISKNMDTNMETETMLSFYNIGKNIFLNQDASLNVQKLYLQTSNLMISGAGSTEQYQRKSLDAIVEAMKINLGLIEPTLIKTFDFDYNNPYEVTSIGKGLYDGVTRKTLPSFIGKTKSEVASYGLSNNITIYYNYITSENPLFKEELENDTVVSQSISANTLLENISSLTVGIISK